METVIPSDQALPEEFDVPGDIRPAVEAIRDKYRMALPFQMADELVDAGMSLELALHVVIGDLRTAAARLVWIACELEKREPRRELWLRRAEEDLDIAKEWFAALPREEVREILGPTGGDHG